MIDSFCHKDHKLTKWGKPDDSWGTYAGPNYPDQLWKLVPRYKLTVGLLFS